MVVFAPKAVAHTRRRSHPHSSDSPEGEARREGARLRSTTRREALRYVVDVV